MKDEHILVGALLFLALLIVGSVVASDRSAKKWEAFKVAHACKVVAHIDGSTSTTIGVSGNGQATVGVGSTSAKKGWLCNDGITYYKE